MYLVSLKLESVGTRAQFIAGGCFRTRRQSHAECRLPDRVHGDVCCRTRPFDGNRLIGTSGHLWNQLFQKKLIRVGREMEYRAYPPIDASIFSLKNEPMLLARRNSERTSFAEYLILVSAMSLMRSGAVLSP